MIKVALDMHTVVDGCYAKEASGKNLSCLADFGWKEVGVDGREEGGRGAVSKSVKKGNKNIFFQVMLNEVQNIFEK